MKRTFKEKLLTILAAGMLVIPSLLGMMHSTMSVAAEGESTAVTVRLHKVVSKDEKEDHQNTGGVDDHFKDHIKVNGVKFQAYEVTTLFQAKLDSVVGGAYSDMAEKRKEAFRLLAEELKNKDNSYFTAKLGSGVIQMGGAQTTAGEGIATFADLPQAGTEGNRVYVFVEIDNKNATNAANNEPLRLKGTVNTLLGLPIISDEDVEVGKKKDELDLYPKNKVREVPLYKHLIPRTKEETGGTKDEDFVSVNDGKQHNGPGLPPTVTGVADTVDQTVFRSIGEKVKFEISYTFPEGWSDQPGNKNFKLVDLPDVGLSFSSITIKGVLDGEKYPTQNQDPLFDVGIEDSNSSTTSAWHINGLQGTVKYYAEYTGETPAASKETGKRLELELSRENPQNSQDYRWRDLAGRTIKFELTMLVNAEAPIKENMNNFISSTFVSGETEEKDEASSEFVMVFKKGFGKVDGGTQSLITESAAAFILTRKVGEETQYYAGLNNKKEVQWVVPTTGDASKPGNFTSTNGVVGEVAALGGYKVEEGGTAKVQVFWTTNNGEKEGTISGKFNLPGLEKGNYTLIEVAAPQGYYLDKAEFSSGLSFSVGAGVGENVGDPSSGMGQTSYVLEGGGQAGGKLQQIKNYPEGFLPSTGGIGIVIFIVIGVTAMGIGAYALVRNRKSTGNIG